MSGVFCSSFKSDKPSPKFPILILIRRFQGGLSSIMLLLLWYFFYISGIRMFSRLFSVAYTCLIKLVMYSCWSEFEWIIFFTTLFADLINHFRFLVIFIFHSGILVLVLSLLISSTQVTICSLRVSFSFLIFFNRMLFQVWFYFLVVLVCAC